MVQWWCSAQGQAWDWTWQAYVGVWLFVFLLAAGYRHLLSMEAPPGTPAEIRTRRRHLLYFGAGLLTLWGALDWPLGPLGASYLASVHMVQFLMVALASPALMLLGIPRGVYERLRESRRLYRLLRSITHPVSAFGIFNLIMVVSHWPSVVDTLRTTQLGSFVLDLAWLLAGLCFWWPVIAPLPARPLFSPLLRMAYLGVNAVIIRPPFVMLLWAKYPIYATYELAPPLPGVDPLNDQQLAGGLMKLGMGWILGVGIALVFFNWVKAEKEKEASDRLAYGESPDS